MICPASGDIFIERTQKFFTKAFKDFSLLPFYTPDWLAEKMVNDILKDDPELSIMDPSCGSGTFLFKVIQYKINILSKKGMEKSAILDHVLGKVIGFDIHPLAATIAKTNYLYLLTLIR